MFKNLVLMIIMLSLSNIAFSSNSIYVYGAECKYKTCSTPYTFYACCYMPKEQPNVLWVATPVMPLSYGSQLVACSYAGGGLPPQADICNLKTPAILGGKLSTSIPSNYIIIKIKVTWPPKPMFN